MLKDIAMNNNYNNTIFNSFPRPATLNLPVSTPKISTANGPALVLRVQSALAAWVQSIARRRAEDRMRAIAQSDPRLMADLGLACKRAP